MRGRPQEISGKTALSAIGSLHFTRYSFEFFRPVPSCLIPVTFLAKASWFVSQETVWMPWRSLLVQRLSVPVVSANS